MKNEALLEVNSLHISVGEKEILHGVDLTVGRDETHVLMGRTAREIHARLRRHRQSGLHRDERQHRI